MHFIEDIGYMQDTALYSTCSNIRAISRKYFYANFLLNLNFILGFDIYEYIVKLKRQFTFSCVPKGK